MKVEVECKSCGDGFMVIMSRATKAKFCSMKCKNKAQAEKYESERVSKTCPACSKEFSFPKCHESRRKFCSVECAEPNKVNKVLLGKDNHNWSGGIHNHKDGYLYEYCMGHPLITGRPYILQHRLVMEGVLKRDQPDHKFLIDIDGHKVLAKGIEVHHLNEVRDDNLESNLVACTSKAHTAFHFGLVADVDDYYPNTVKPNKQHSTRVERVCAKCYKTFEVPAHRRKASYCSKLCMNNRAILQTNTGIKL